MIRSGSGDQQSGGRRGRSGRKRRSWTDQAGQDQRGRGEAPKGGTTRRRWTDQPPPPPPPRRSHPEHYPPPQPYYETYGGQYETPPRYYHPPPYYEARPYEAPPPYYEAPPYPPPPPGYPRRRPTRPLEPPEDYPEPHERTERAAEEQAAPPPPPAGSSSPARPSAGPQYPKKLTVTRVAAIRGRQLTSQAVDAFRRATRADGADKSGLTALTYATMLNYASDAAMAVALANTLFFSPTDADASKGKVALYLLITVAPFALIAPIIGPALDKIQRGRRLAMIATSIGQALMCVLMATNFEGWLLYVGALGKMVLSKSFTVLKAAVTPRVVPPDITLAKTNARLTVFGLLAGTAFGGVAGLVAAMSNSAGALWFTAVLCVVGAIQGIRIPAWVEVTEGEVPASISAKFPAKPQQTRRQPMGRHLVVALSGNATIRLLTGFLMFFAAFAVRAQTEGEPFKQLLLLGLIAGGAGVGSFVGNAIGARLHVGHPEQVVLGCIVGALVSTVVATIVQGVVTAMLVGLIGATASALAKNSLDAVIQDDMPEESRASAFGRSETVLQLSWVFGGALGVLLPTTWWVGFLVISVLLALGLVQTLLTRQGASLLPWFGGTRPVRPGRIGSPGRWFAATRSGQSSDQESQQ